MVNQNVLAANGREQVFAPASSARSWRARSKRDIAQMLAIRHARDLGHGRQVERARDAINFAVRISAAVPFFDLFRFHDQANQLVADVGGYFNAYGLTARARSRSRFSISRSMSSDSCSSNSTSLSRVIRNVVLVSTSKPPNNSGSRRRNGVFEQNEPQVSALA